MFFHVIDLKSVKGLQIFEQPDCDNGGYQDACIALLRSYRGADADTVSLSDRRTVAGHGCTWIIKDERIAGRFCLFIFDRHKSSGNGSRSRENRTVLPQDTLL